jgi:hypothetical protein
MGGAEGGVAVPARSSPEFSREAPGGLPKLFVLDTNVILHDARCILNFCENDVAIPITVLEELDQFKRGNRDINAQAREFLRRLDGITGAVLSTDGAPLGEGMGRVQVVFRGSASRPSPGGVPERLARSPHPRDRARAARGAAGARGDPRLEGHEPPHESEVLRARGRGLHERQGRAPRPPLHREASPRGDSLGAHQPLLRQWRDGPRRRPAVDRAPVPERELRSAERLEIRCSRLTDRGRRSSRASRRALVRSGAEERGAVVRARSAGQR